jgi:hypothetical protein
VRVYLCHRVQRTAQTHKKREKNIACGVLRGCHSFLSAMSALSDPFSFFLFPYSLSLSRGVSSVSPLVVFIALLAGGAPPTAPHLISSDTGLRNDCGCRHFLSFKPLPLLPSSWSAIHTNKQTNTLLDSPPLLSPPFTVNHHSSFLSWFPCLFCLAPQQ